MEWFQTPNYVEGRTEAIDLLVIHATRSGIAGNDDEPGTINWFRNPKSKASSHRLIGTHGAESGFVADWDTAWHAGYLNARSLGMEVCQPTEDAPFTPIQVVNTAVTVRTWCLVHGVPMVHITDEDQRGVIGHDETEQGKSCGKSDPGYNWPWLGFIQLVQEDDVTLAELQAALTALEKKTTTIRQQESLHGAVSDNNMIAVIARLQLFGILPMDVPLLKQHLGD